MILGNEIYAPDSVVYLDGDQSVVVGNVMRCGEATATMCYIDGSQNVVVGNSAAECTGPGVYGKGNVVAGNITRTRAKRGGTGNIVIEDDLTERVAALEARLAALEGVAPAAE